ncbi:hypothetical protein UNSWDHB_620 [Dehalobacter sp. UNSWDHB]|jgi:hypothetical protein|uniref:hypothetical protein n=1 Tax=unclassified Dehalobacter TaxID=2635733 RepID=UPI00028B322F|nr:MULTISPECIES: hypothetical protein [unclassified Dehalobacter]AFV02639.1 hypothetical protein DHBDCA_p1611 [Dehalobacter sp. DCA]AFV05624.1 hypothetical protein DCF50_p1620 [Dehalobacter sp. CF]EQB22061.1 hypothetical protein UNSWDHB_620 [Dehalobacter sp. UNSWDHB]
MNDQLQEMLAMPGVIGFGNGIKETNGHPTGTEALLVFVEKKIPRSELGDNECVPNLINNILTDVIEIGEIFAHNEASGRRAAAQGFVVFLRNLVGNPAKNFPKTLHKNLTFNFNAKATTKERINAGDFLSLWRWLIKERGGSSAVSRISLVRPAVPGVSIGHYQGGAGTFGALVYDKKSSQPLILSNNHVLANTSMMSNARASINDLITQPAGIDGSNEAIGYLARYAALNVYPNPNCVDCAVAKPVSAAAVSPEILEIGKVTGVTEAAPGMTVKKSGRTTGLTIGKIRAINSTVKVNYGEGRILLFEKQIIASKMSEPGDSGSLVVDFRNRAVGLLFAGSNQSTIINPINQVLETLQVKF